MGLTTIAGKEAVLVQLREPGPDSDKLISAVLGLDLKAWTRDFRLAESLIPLEAIYTLSHNDDRSFYWCDISSDISNVQGWGRTPACALAAAGVAYLIDKQHYEGDQKGSSAGSENVH